ncbi:MAG: hypothetical protein FWG65_01155 [Turicibacter sp.]|nr:hypothetical protein [Turicibacter sp.]
MVYDILQAIYFMAENSEYVVLAYMIIHVLVVVLRLLTFISMRGINTLMQRDLIKPLKAITEAVSIKSSLLRRIVSDYRISASKNAPSVPSAAIVDKHITNLSILGLRYSGINSWTDKLENSLVLLGIVFMLAFTANAPAFAIIAGLGFIVTKFSNSFFDYETARKLLAADIVIYLEREIGQFFASHITNAVTNFEKEMATVTENQAQQIRQAIEKLSADIIPALTHLGVLVNLPKAMETMQQSNDRYAMHHESLINHAQIIEDTQKALESSLAAYETTLQTIVQTMGAGFGAFIDLHTQNATKTITEAIETLNKN